MCYLVEASFSTDAPGLVLSPTPGEDAVLLVADNCSIEIRLRALDVDASRSSSSNGGGSEAPPYLLEAQPWDTARLRLRVNGISYGTGPLLLRDRDCLTLQTLAATEDAQAAEYSYTVSRLRDTLSSPRPPTAEADTDASPCNEAAQHNYTIAANMSEYAKWNNFYADRFGSRANAPAAVLSACGCCCRFRHCSCGRYLPTCAGVTGETPATTGSCAGTQESQRLLVTLFPSLPALLLSTEEGEEQKRGAASPAVVMCCACPAAPSLQRCERALKRAFSKNQKIAPAGSKVEDAATELAPTPAMRQTPWATYASARAWELKGSLTADAAKDGATRGSATLVEPCDRSSMELLRRLASVESALMGCRYE